MVYTLKVNLYYKESNRTNRLSLQGLWIFMIQIFFVLMLTLPTAFQMQRGVFLALITAVAGIFALKQWSVNRDIFYIWLATIVVGFFGVFWGVVNDAPGALRVSTVYIVWPALFLIYIGLSHSLNIIKALEKAVFLGILLATITSLIVMFAGYLGYEEVIYPLLVFLDAGFGSYDGHIAYRVYSLTTVMYGFTFILSYILVNRSELQGFKRVFIYTLLVFIVIAALGSARRAFWLVMLLGPFVALFFLQASYFRLNLTRFLSLIFKIFFVFLIFVPILILILKLDLNTLLELFVSAFSSQESSTGLRFLQAESLWSKFIQSPLIGHGLGSAADVVRSSEQPWAYELSYLALLMNVGVIGFIVYAAAVLWIIVKGIKISRKDSAFAKLFVPLVSALCTFLIMNATNPYLGKFDYLWVIFLPLALINAYLTQRTQYD